MVTAARQGDANRRSGQRSLRQHPLGGQRLSPLLPEDHKAGIERPIGPAGAKWNREQRDAAGAVSVFQDDRRVGRGSESREHIRRRRLDVPPTKNLDAVDERIVGAVEDATGIEARRDVSPRPPTRVIRGAVDRAQAGRGQSGAVAPQSSSPFLRVGIWSRNQHQAATASDPGFQPFKPTERQFVDLFPHEHSRGVKLLRGEFRGREAADRESGRERPRGRERVVDERNMVRRGVRNDGDLDRGNRGQHIRRRVIHREPVMGLWRVGHDFDREFLPAGRHRRFAQEERKGDRLRLTRRQRLDRLFLDRRVGRAHLDSDGRRGPFARVPNGDLVVERHARRDRPHRSESRHRQVSHRRVADIAQPPRSVRRVVAGVWGRLLNAFVRRVLLRIISCIVSCVVSCVVNCVVFRVVRCGNRIPVAFAKVGADEHRAAGGGAGVEPAAERRQCRGPVDGGVGAGQPINGGEQFVDPCGGKRHALPAGHRRRGGDEQRERILACGGTGLDQFPEPSFRELESRAGRADGFHAERVVEQHDPLAFGTSRASRAIGAACVSGGGKCGPQGTRDDDSGGEHREYSEDKQRAVFDSCAAFLAAPSAGEESHRGPIDGPHTAAAPPVDRDGNGGQQRAARQQSWMHDPCPQAACEQRLKAVHAGIPGSG